MKLVYLLASLVLVTHSLFALSITISEGIQEEQKYSTLHMRNPDPFTCHEKKDDFEKIVYIECLFKNQPTSEVKLANNDFFRFQSENIGDNYKILIYPKQKIKIFPIVNDLTEKTTLKVRSEAYALHWFFIGYSQNLPYLKYVEPKRRGLKFPLMFDTYMRPLVGPLDLNEEPIIGKDIKDVSKFVIIKKLFENKKYDQVIEEVNDLFEQFPHTIFESDLLYYRIHSRYELGMYEELYDDGKLFIRKYPTDDNVAEVMLELAHSYQKIGMFKDMDYFFDRLFEEQADTEQAIKALIFIGDKYASTGQMNKAEEYYKKSLFQTKNLETASLAAERLAEYYSSKGMVDEARKYYTKIVQSYPEYYFVDIDKSYELAKDLARKQLQDVAATLTKALMNQLPKLDERREDFLYHIGVWEEESNQIEDAYKTYQEYLATYGYGNYNDDINTRLDKLFFDMKEDNKTIILQKYDELITKYKDDPTGQKALYEKGKLLFAMKKYLDVLEIEKPLKALDELTYPDTKLLIDDSALNIAQNELLDQNCSGAFEYMHQYDLNLSSKFDVPLYTCYYQYGKYEQALDIASRHSDEMPLEEKVVWLERIFNNQLRLGRCKEALNVSDDIIKLSDIIQRPKLKELRYEQVGCFAREENEEKLIETAILLEKEFPKSYRNITSYVEVLKIGQKRNDDVMVENYAVKVMELQKKTKSYTNTPFVEFTYVDALKHLKKFSTAIDILRGVIKQDIKPSEAARAYYLLGGLYQQADKIDLAKESYQMSVEKDATSAWGKISQDTLKLLDK